MNQYQRTNEQEIATAPSDLWGGDDDAIATPDADAFRRAPFAKHLADVIKSAPDASSFRIGIFGDWGEGKTSVMALMEHYLPTDAFVCVRVSAWDVTSAKDIVKRVAAALASIAGTDRGVAARWTIMLTRVGAGQHALRKAAADSHWALKGLDRLFGDVAENAADRKAAAAVKRQIDVAVERLGPRRAVVFVDDLDRADAAGLPRVILALREAVPVPGTVFVLALSADAVRNAIAKSNYGLESAERFLEKIIEYPAYLPPIPPDALHRYAAERISEIGGLRHPELLQDVSQLLPKNPRRLKRFLRKLSALRATLDRFDDGEVNWLALYVAQLLLSEFPNEALSLRDDSRVMKALESAWLAHLLPPASGESGERPEARFAPNDDEQGAQFIAICDLFRQQHWIGTRYRVAALLHLDDAPPVMTVREARRLVEELERMAPAAWPRRLSEAMTRDGRVIPEIARALWSHVLEFRDASVTTSFRTIHAEEHTNAANTTVLLMSIMEVLVVDLRAFESGWLGMQAWAELLDAIGPWANARVSRHEEVLLVRELDLVEAAVGVAPISLVDLALRHIRNREDFAIAKERPDVYRDRMQSIAAELEVRLGMDALVRFQRADGLAVYSYCEWDEHAKWFVFDASASLYRQPQLDVFKSLALDAESGSAILRRNFLTFLRTLADAARARVRGVEAQQAVAILLLPSVAHYLWRGAVSATVTVTGAQLLQDVRAQLIEIGVSDTELILPSWWPSAVFDSSNEPGDGEAPTPAIPELRLDQRAS